MAPSPKKGGQRTKRKIITRKDINKERAALPVLIGKLVKRLMEGDHEIKENSAFALLHILQMDHGKHAAELFRARAVKPLVLLLATGSANAQTHAAAALAGIAANELEHQQAIVAAGGVKPLVGLLKTGSAKVQEDACCALAALNAEVRYQAEVIREGAIPALVAVLRNGSAQAQASAAQAVANVATFSHDAQRNVAKHGAIPLLLTLLGHGKAQQPAATALARLAHSNREIQGVISETGGIPPLLALLNGLDVEVQVAAAAALAEMACDNADTQSLVAKAGGIGPLLALLSSRSSAAQSHGMAALAQLARNNSENQDAIARMDGLRPLVQLLEGNDDDADVLSSAACAIMEICRRNLDNQRAIVDFGGISQLASLMKLSSHNAVRAEVAGALWTLSEDPEIKVMIAAAATINPLVNLLGGGGDRAQHHAASALASLGLNNKHNQVQITQMLIELLISGTTEAQERAAQALWALVHENPEAHDVIANAGNPAACVELLKTGIANARDYALWSLSLSICAENQATVAEAGGVQPLISQLADERPLIRGQAAAALAKLARDSDETRSMIAKLGGVQPLIALLETSDPLSLPQHSAAPTSETVPSSSGTVHKAGSQAPSTDPYASGGAATAGIQSPIGTQPLDIASAPSTAPSGSAPPPLAPSEAAPAPPKTKPLLAGGVHEMAVDALANLAAEPAARDEIVRAGGIPPLVQLLETEGRNTKKYVATALARLSQNHEATQTAIAKAGAIIHLVALLDGREGPEAQEAAAGAILALADSPTNRLTITESGGEPIEYGHDHRQSAWPQDTSHQERSLQLSHC